jgi:hypothetical protein
MGMREHHCCDFAKPVQWKELLSGSKKRFPNIDDNNGVIVIVRTFTVSPYPDKSSCISSVVFSSSFQAS